MLISSVKYPSISAKINGMYAQKIKKSDLEELVKQNTTKQAIALLKNLNQGFKELEDNPRRIKLKILLDDILITDIKKIYRLLNKKDKEVFMSFISSFEIKCIKSIFRKLSSSSTINEQTNEVENWVNRLFTKLSGIENVQDYDEFKEYIKKTPYKSIFEKYDNINEISVFEIENKLDKMYFEKMMKIAKNYNNHLEDMLGKEIDLNNIIWMYRVKMYYHFSKEELKNILINVQYKLKKQEIEKLIESNTEKEMIDVLKKTYYAKYINFNDLPKLEENVDCFLYILYKKYFRESIFNISTIYAYLNIIEEENNDIMNVVEGIRYGLDKNEIRKKLVR